MTQNSVQSVQGQALIPSAGRHVGCDASWARNGVVIARAGRFVTGRRVREQPRCIKSAATSRESRNPGRMPRRFQYSEQFEALSGESGNCRYIIVNPPARHPTQCSETWPIRQSCPIDETTCTNAAGSGSGTLEHSIWRRVKSETELGFSHSVAWRRSAILRYLGPRSWPEPC